MPVWTKEKSTKEDLEFVLSCDCGDFNCPKILFSYFKDPEYKELYLSNIPGRYPIPLSHLFKRIKYAWNYLVHGKLVYKDSLVVNTDTLGDLIEKLKFTHNEMVDSKHKFNFNVYICEEFINLEPNKYHTFITDIPEDGMLYLMKEYTNSIGDKKFNSVEFLLSLEDRGIYIEDLFLDINPIDIDLMYGNNLLKG